MAAEGKVGLMMNVQHADLTAVLGILPALQNPTISSLSDQAWVAVNTIIDENTVRHIIPQLKAAGATGHRRVSAEQDHRLTTMPRISRDVPPRSGFRCFTDSERTRGAEHPCLLLLVDWI